MSKIIYPKVTFKDISVYFWRGMGPHKWFLFFLVAMVAGIGIISSIIPVFYKQFFDTISMGSVNPEDGSKLISIIIHVGLLNGGLWILYRTYNFCNNFFQATVMARLKQQAYDYLVQHSYGFFANSFTGSLVQKVNRFSRSFEMLTDNIIWNLCSLAARVISILIILFFINKMIALVMMSWALAFLFSNVAFAIWKIKYDLKLAAADSKTTAYLADTVANQNTVSLFDKFKFESSGYKSVTNEQAKIQKFSWNLTAYVEAGQSALGFSIEFILFYFAVMYWQQGLITVGFFVLLQLYIFGIIEQLWGFTRVIRHIYQGYADAKEMVEIMKLPHEIVDMPGAKDLLVTKGQIEFKNLNFAFNETRAVLKKINIAVKPGEKVALIGPSGAGKTTFVKLLLRLYSPTSGQIFIDGQDIAKVTQGSLRQNVSMVPQDPVLFHRTLAENIAYGKPGASKKEIAKAAKLAHCDEFIKDLPQGMETFVGERGIKLSGGERQRVAIARAILKNAPILVLDEATSSLDSHSEMLIQDALATLMKGKTTIVIAHRLSTIQRMDRITVVDNGKIIEQGSHTSLLEKEGSLYKKLWTLQAGGFMMEEDEEE